MLATFTAAVVHRAPNRRRLACVSAAFAFFAFAGWFLAPQPALAHVYVRSSDPLPGAKLGIAPGVVVVSFSGILDPALSRIVVAGPDGRSHPGSASTSELRVLLPSNAPGVYRVQWKAVDAMDGHTTASSYRFAVATTVAVAANAPAGGSRLEASNAFLATTRVIESIALLLAGGLVLLTLLSRRRPELSWLGKAIEGRMRLVLVVALASGILVVIGEAALAEGPLPPSALLHYLSSGFSGWARSLRLLLEGLAVAFAIASSYTPLAVALGGALVFLSASGHAAALPHRLLGITTDAGHLLAAAVWVGGIMALATVRPPKGWRSDEARALLRSFTPFALGAFAVAVVLGGVQAIQEVGALRLLWSTSYGRVLLVKMGVIGAMIPFSMIAWRRRMFGRTEAVLGVGAVAVAALLSVVPVPHGEAMASTVPMAGSAAAAMAPSLPKPGDLTLGGHAGQYLVGLTLTPGTPGRNDAFLYVGAAEAPAGPVHVVVTARHRHLRLGACMPNCRVGALDLASHELVRVNVVGPRGGTAVFTVPNLPALRAQPLLARARRSMHTLRSYRLREVVVTAHGVTIRSDYAFRAPGKMQLDVLTHPSSTTIWVGGRRYLRHGPHAAWKTSTGRPPARIPSFVWDYFHAVLDPRVVGYGRVSGLPATLVSFFGRSSNNPVWFRLWITRKGMVLRAQAWSIGHFIDHRYYAFDRGFSIRPPSKAAAHPR